MARLMCTDFWSANFCFVLVAGHFLLIHGSSVVNLTVEGGVSLVGPHCPGTVRLFCEGVELPTLMWMYNGSIIIGKFFTPADTATTETDTSNPAFLSVQLTNVSQSSEDPRFASFFSILTVNLSQLEQRNIMCISCGDPVIMDTVPVDVHIKPEAVPEDPQLIGTNASLIQRLDNQLHLAVMIKWQQSQTCSEYDQRVFFIATLLLNEVNSIVAVNNSVCTPLCSIVLHREYVLTRESAKNLTVYLQAVNSIGGSNITDYTFKISGITPVLCDVPQSPVNGSAISQSSLLLVGSEVTYRCDDGLFPTGVITSMCTDVGGRGEWVPDPAQLVCELPQVLDVTTNSDIISSDGDGSLSIEVVAGVSAAAAFFVALLLGFLLGLVLCLVTHKKGLYSPAKEQAKTQVQHTTNPVYEEVTNATPVEEIKMDSNQAYEPIQH